MSEPNIQQLQSIDDLQRSYINAIDQKDMNVWLDSFANEAQYICVTAESVEAGLPIAYIMDDCRARIEDRVRFVTKVWAGTFQDYRTRHFVQRLSCEILENQVIRTRSNFIVTFTRSDTRKTDIFASGTYLDDVVVAGGVAVFLSKQVILDADMLPHYMTYPL